MDEQRKVQLIRDFYSHPAWKEYFLPLYLEKQAALNHALRNPSLMRKHETPDDYVRGKLDEIDFLLNHFPTVAVTTENALVEEELAKSREESYDVIARYGLNAPYGAFLERTTDAES